MCVYTYYRDTLTVDTNQEELGVTVMPNDHQLKELISLEDSNKDMGDTISPAVTTNTTTTEEIQTVLKPVSHLLAAGQEESLVPATCTDQQKSSKENSKQCFIEIPSAPVELTESQEMKWKDQETQCKDRDKESLEKSSYHITHEKSYFQKYLIDKGLNYQWQFDTKRAETSGLELCLSMYTDSDVLDENNKFICKACTDKKQCVYAYKIKNLISYVVCTEIL